MLDTILILGIIAMAGIAFNIQNRREILQERKKRRGKNGEEENDISRTINLIGEKAYIEMTDRIQKISEKHGKQQNITVSLTCGPDTIDGAHELHRLLPGQPVKMVTCRTEGVDTIDVYFNGVRIGRLALNDASEIYEILDRNMIVGAYVAEQNCYRKIGSHQMDLIIFYKSKEKSRDRKNRLKKMAEIVRNRKDAMRDICYN